VLKKTHLRSSTAPKNAGRSSQETKQEALQNDVRLKSHAERSSKKQDEKWMRSGRANGGERLEGTVTVKMASMTFH